MRRPRLVISKGRLALAAAAGLAFGGYVLVVRGSLTVDLGVGRTVRPLGPLARDIAAPRDVVFEVVSTPYLRRSARALESKLRVLERSGEMVLAEHYTQVGPLVATTVETVRFDAPERIQFRLVRGPVPYAAEEFLLRKTDRGTQLEYRGELGADLWAAGRLWTAAVARVWTRAVDASLDAIQAEAERRATRSALAHADMR
jgi:hypothetical protein